MESVNFGMIVPVPGSVEVGTTGGCATGPAVTGGAAVAPKIAMIAALAAMDRTVNRVVRVLMPEFYPLGHGVYMNVHFLGRTGPRQKTPARRGLRVGGDQSEQPQPAILIGRRAARGDGE